MENKTLDGTRMPVPGNRVCAIDGAQLYVIKEVHGHQVVNDAITWNVTNNFNVRRIIYWSERLKRWRDV